MPGRSISDLVADQDLLWTGPDASVRDVARQMADRHVGAIIILEGGLLTGIFTERDLLQRVVAADLDPRVTPVGEVMSRDPVSVPMSEPGIEAMRLMLEHNIRHVVITGVGEGGDRFGIISIRDFAGGEIALFERELEFQKHLWEEV